MIFSSFILFRAETTWGPFMFGHLEMVEEAKIIVPVMATPTVSTLSLSAAQLKVGGNLGI